MTPDPTVLPIAVSMLACLQEAVADLDAPPASTMLRTGTQIELLLSMTSDECCTGLGWVRVVTVVPSAMFPAPDESWRPDWPIQYAVTLELGVTRCAPTTGAATIPTADAWNEVTTAVLNDGSAMRRAIACWVEGHRDQMYLVGPWLPLNTEGGCVGGTYTITIAADACE